MLSPQLTWFTLRHCVNVASESARIKPLSGSKLSGLFTEWSPPKDNVCTTLPITNFLSNDLSSGEIICCFISDNKYLRSLVLNLINGNIISFNIILSQGLLKSLISDQLLPVSLR
jgi:hypothetical protein